MSSGWLFCFFFYFLCSLEFIVEWFFANFKARYLRYPWVFKYCLTRIFLDIFIILSNIPFFSKNVNSKWKSTNKASDVYFQSSSYSYPYFIIYFCIDSKRKSVYSPIPLLCLNGYCHYLPSLTHVCKHEYHSDQSSLSQISNCFLLFFSLQYIL